MAYPKMWENTFIMLIKRTNYRIIQGNIKPVEGMVLDFLFGRMGAVIKGILKTILLKERCFTTFCDLI